MAPTELEGLHNPPMEASLCGCGLVASDHEMGGMSDYVIDCETALVYPAGDLKKAEERVKILMNNDPYRKWMWSNMYQVLERRIGNREDNMQKMLEIIG